MIIDNETKRRLIQLAEGYETEEFIKDDPVQFPRQQSYKCS